MSDTPEEKARRKKLLDELRKLDEELGIAGIEITPEEAVSMVKQVRKEMAEDREARRIGWMWLTPDGDTIP